MAMRIYVDSSVVGGCLDEEFAQESLALFDMARQARVIILISDLLVDELRGGPKEVLSILDSLPPEGVEYVKATGESRRLRDAYLAAGVVGPSSDSDAHHVAPATLAKADLIVSWNFRHIVHVEKIRRFNAVNLVNGYGLIDIRSPFEVV